VALYFWRVLGLEWPHLPSTENFADVRRLYRYIWVVYGLLMTLFGAQQILRYIFFVPTGLLGEITRETLVNGLSLLLIGTPIWVYAWGVVQRSLSDEAERDSNLRLLSCICCPRRCDHGAHCRGHGAAHPLMHSLA
jgi:hypothetical protein